MNPSRINAETVRFWAWVDSGLATLALPPVAESFVQLLYRCNGWLGGVDQPPPFEPVHWLFVCLLGVLVGCWSAARLLQPTALLALIDSVGRAAVAALLAWFILARGAPAVLAVFIVTELAGALAQGVALRRRQAGL